MKPIYSAIVYKYDKRDAYKRLVAVKAPCTSKKAAMLYIKTLRKWWNKNEWSVGIDEDYPCDIKTAQELLKLPF